MHDFMLPQSYFVQTPGPGSTPSYCAEEQALWPMALRHKVKRRGAWLLLTLVPAVKGKTWVGADTYCGSVPSWAPGVATGLWCLCPALLDESSWVETRSTWQSTFTSSLANVVRRTLNKGHWRIETKASRYRGKLSIGAMCLGQGNGHTPWESGVPEAQLGACIWTHTALEIWKAGRWSQTRACSTLMWDFILKLRWRYY